MNNPMLQKIRSFSLLVGQGAFDLGANLIVMILVQRSLGTAGLGIFSYLLSLQMFAAFISEFGLPDFLEREVAITPEKSKQTPLIEDAARSVLLTGFICVVLFVTFSLSGITWTRVEERSAAYVIIAVTIVLRNFNALKIAILQGRGEYGTMVKLKTYKRLYLLGSVFLFLQWGLAPSYLMLGYFASEVGFAINSYKQIRLPKIRMLLRGWRNVRATLEQSANYILTDDALDVIFYMDFLILGIFISSRDLGVYAQASILARMFLIIPISIRPVFLVQYCALASENRLKTAANAIRASASILFFVHSVLAVYFLLFFPAIQRSLFHARQLDPTAFYIFAEILPGLLFFSAVTPQEPVYEADGKAGNLRKIIIIIAGLNLLLNLFFVPFAGFFGAAFATAASMFAYFVFFGSFLGPAFKMDKLNYFFAGAAVYLTFMLFRALDWGVIPTAVTVPGFLFLLLSLMGFFNVDAVSDIRRVEPLRMAWTNQKQEA